MSFSVNTLISSVKLVQLPYFSEENGCLTFVENNNSISFDIARVFIVRAQLGALRGAHAHKLCAQFLICPKGQVVVTCSDGFDTLEFKLSSPNVGLYVPPGIWATQNYQENDTVLLVLCDRLYESDDYIRDHAEYLTYRKE